MHQETCVKLLVVDDSPEDREFYRRLLLKNSSCSYLIREAECGEEGLRILQSEEIGCILLDYNLPDIDGLDFLKKISAIASFKKIPKIFLTGQGNEYIAVNAMKSGASDYLVKGELSKDLLVRVIQNAIDLKSKEIVLEDHLSFLTTLIDTIPNPIYYQNTRGEYIGCNRAFESVIGMSKAQIIGRRDDILFPEALVEVHREKDQRLCNDHGIDHYEGKARYADGIRDVIFYKATFPSFDGTVAGLVGVILDITERKRMEEHLQRAKKDLESHLAELKEANQTIREQQKSVIEEERLKLLLQLSGATAHELNQPLTALLGNIELLKMKNSDPDEVYNRLHHIERAGQEIADIVQRIHSIRRDETIPYVFDEVIINLNQKVNILSIEESDSDFENIRSVVKDRPNIILSRAGGVTEAAQALEKEKFDLVFVDYMLPDGTAFDFIKIMRQRKLEIPVIVITGQGNEMIASKLIQDGAYDYIPKQMLNANALSRSIANALERHRLKRDLKLATERITEMSIRDELTGLYNRRYLAEALEREISRSRRYNEKLSLCLVALDDFETINDSLGHPAGDQVLSEIGILLQENIRECDVASRYGDEEFAIILTNTDLDTAIQLSERFVIKLASHEFAYHSSPFRITASVGVSSFGSSSNQSVTQLIGMADKALCLAKEKGRNRVVAL